MKERPILFSKPMILALLAGTKSQTRRAVKRVSRFSAAGKPFDCIMDLDGLPSRLDLAPDNWELCPYGVPSDRLWVRETFCYSSGYVAPEGTVCYRANLPADESTGWKWKPSIFMRRADSRITLEVVSTRIERLQEISEEDARAEGVIQKFTAWLPHEGGTAFSTAREAYRSLWDDINGIDGPGAWEASPWVWVVSFRRLP